MIINAIRVLINGSATLSVVKEVITVVGRGVVFIVWVRVSQELLLMNYFQILSVYSYLRSDMRKMDDFCEVPHTHSTQANYLKIPTSPHYPRLLF